VTLTTHPQSSTKVKERVELYLSFPSVFVACTRVNFTFTFVTETGCVLCEVQAVSKGRQLVREDGLFAWVSRGDLKVK